MKHLFLLNTIFINIVFVDICYGISFDENSPEVAKMSDLYIDLGKALPVTSFPISDREFVEVAKALEPYADDEQLNSIHALIDPLLSQSSDYAFFPRGNVTLDATATFAKSLPTGGTEGTDGLEDLKAYLRKEPFLYGGLGVDHPLRGFAYIDIEARERYRQTNPDFNLPLDKAGGSWTWQVEDHDVKHGVIAFFQDDFDIWIGRDKNQYGPSKSSLICDPDVPYLDSVRFEYYAGPFTLSYRLSTLDNRQAVSDVTPVEPYAFMQNTILNTVHRFQYAGSNFEVAITGEQFVVRPQNSFQVTDMLPVISWHNADIMPNNMSLIFDVSGTPLPGLKLAAQVGFDDIDGNVVGIHDDDTPTVDAEIISMSIPRFLGLYVELGHTHYLWGSFDDDVAMARAIYRVPLMGGTQAIPMTSPYGPGSVWAHVETTKAVNKSISVGSAVELIGKKDNDNLFDTNYARSSTLASEGYRMTVNGKISIVYKKDHWAASAAPGVRIESSGLYPSAEISSTYSLN